MSRENALPEARALRGALLKAGVPEVSIELVKGRPAGGDRWNNQFVVTDTAHHTASRYSRDNLTPCLSLVKKGRSDLPGPLCNGYGGWDLCARIITLGYANHPGQGGPLTVPSGVKKPPSYTIPKDSAPLHVRLGVRGRHPRRRLGHRPDQPPQQPEDDVPGVHGPLPERHPGPLQPAAGRAHRAQDVGTRPARSTGSTTPGPGPRTR
jgi:hypothetical protein